jgi:hypothetical protein
MIIMQLIYFQNTQSHIKGFVYYMINCQDKLLYQRIRHDVIDHNRVAKNRFRSELNYIHEVITTPKVT